MPTTPTWVGITEEGSGEQTDAARGVCRSHQAQSDSGDVKEHTWDQSSPLGDT